MSRPYAALTGVATGFAMVGFAAATGLLPNLFPGDDRRSAAVPNLASAQTLLPETGTVYAPATDLDGPDAVAGVSAALRQADLQARLDASMARETALKAERTQLTDQVAQLTALERSLRELTETLSAEAHALQARRTAIMTREADLKLREDDFEQRLSAHRPTRDSAAEPQFPEQRAATPAAEISAPDLIATARDMGAPQIDAPVGNATAAASNAPAPVDSSPHPSRSFADGPIAEVHFELNSAELTPGGRLRAEQAAEQVSQMNVARIRIVGLTDRSGSDSYNQTLSKARADAVADVFVQSGLSRRMIEVVGMGETHAMLPISTGDGVSEPLNRCVGILVEEIAPL